MHSDVLFLLRARLKSVTLFSLTLQKSFSGVQHGTIFGTQAYGLPLGETTTPQYLKSLGYTTRGIGKVGRDNKSLTMINES